MPIDRRQLLAGGGAAFLSGCAGRQPYEGSLGGPSMARGHSVRSGGFPAPAAVSERAGIIIAGGGVAGLAAAWRLAEAGFHDFRLFELEDETGGNARAGYTPVTPHPLGAHYLPVPDADARALRHMLHGFGIITGYAADGAPRYDPLQLCAELDERLFWRGRWQAGLFPETGLSKAERAEHARFEALMAAWRTLTGGDGRRAFASPMAGSSRDPAITGLDRISLAAWADGNGFTAPALRAHLRYACRDDYGCEPEVVSAWAGLHYFAGRRGWAADGAGDRDLTWPEGNGRLVALMRARVADHVVTASPVFQAAPDGGSALVDRFDAASGRSIRARAAVAILALPAHVVHKVAPGLLPATPYPQAPWVVANISVSRKPRGPGVPPAWDNVSAGSESLGYVIATHQSSSAGDGPTVLTWYMPLSTLAPAVARQLIASRNLAAWQQLVAEDLLTMQPDLEGAITRIDVWRWPHAMPVPSPGFLDHPVRRAAAGLAPPLLVAHSDISGLSLFEEAHHRGVLAAEAAMRALGHRFEALA
jgi:phytoene dehydrogenase-like protein